MAASHGLATTVAPADRLDTLPEWPWADLDFAHAGQEVADQAINGHRLGAPRTLGWHAIAWAEGWSGFPDIPDGFEGLTQPNGPRARLPFRFTPRQRRFLLWFYAVDDDGLWLFDSAERRLPKGSGKSPFAAVHALIEFLAPVRLARFDDRAPGGCRGREVDMPLVQITATAEVQTQNTMRYVRAFASKKSHVVEFYELDPGKLIYYGPPERTLQVTTSSVSAAEGAEATFVVKDELEHWVPSNSGPELSSTLDDNVAKSGARSLGTCNAWVPGRESVAEADYEAWVLEQEGKTKGETKQLYDAALPPPETDMADAESLQLALEHLYDDCTWKKPHEPDPDAPGDLRPIPGSKPDVRAIMRRIWDPKARPDDSERKYLNRPVAAQDAWTSKEAWQILADPTRAVEPGEQIALGFDGSKVNDATALIGCCMSDGHVFPIKIWEPLYMKRPVPVADVDRMVELAFTSYEVVAFFADVQEWESFVKIEWPSRYGEKLKIDASGGKDPQKIAWDMRNQIKDFTLAAELVRAEIEDQSFTHDGDAVLGRHVVNAREYPNRWGISISKPGLETRSPHKIDGCVATIIARHARRLALAELAKLGPEPSRRVRTA